MVVANPGNLLYSEIQTEVQVIMMIICGVRKHVQNSKYDPVVERAELLQVNPQYAFVRLKSGHQTTVSLRDIAPCDRPSEEDSQSPTQSVGEESSNMHTVIENQALSTTQNTDNLTLMLILPL